MPIRYDTAVFFDKLCIISLNTIADFSKDARVVIQDATQQYASIIADIISCKDPIIGSAVFAFLLSVLYMVCIASCSGFMLFIIILSLVAATGFVGFMIYYIQRQYVMYQEYDSFINSDIYSVFFYACYAF